MSNLIIGSYFEPGATLFGRYPTLSYPRTPVGEASSLSALSAGWKPAPRPEAAVFFEQALWLLVTVA
jgi:hypothetical protein